MAKRYKLRNARPKASFGLISGALGAVGNIASAEINRRAIEQSAQMQANAMAQAAQTQANALMEQINANRELQTRNMDFTKNENQIMRDFQSSLINNSQLSAGNQNYKNRLNASRIQVKCGGSNRSKKANGGIPFLRGRFNMPFTVLDGGGVVHLGTTSNGSDLYEIYGNDHKHYHKTNGKYESGVGIKFSNGKIIEGEGNQNTNQGELMEVSPNDVKFISKHTFNIGKHSFNIGKYTFKRFNPAKSVKNGMDPDVAYSIQEQIKDIYGINDDGTTSPVERNMAKCGKRSIAKCGKRTKAEYGFSTDEKFNLWGAGLTGIGNLIGAGITNIGNNRAYNATIEGNNRAANIIANAYNRMTGIDTNQIKRSDYATPHVLAAIRDPYININSQLTSNERANQRRLSAINENSLSGAATINRINRSETDAYDVRSKLYEYKNKGEEEIRQNILDIINTNASENANRDLQSSRDYTQAHIDLLKYKNDINNTKLAGIADAYSSATTSNSLANANRLRGNSQNWGSAIGTTFGNFGNTFAGIGKNRNDIENTLLGADMEQRLNYYIARNDKNGIQTILNRIPDDTNNKYLIALRTMAQSALM